MTSALDDDTDQMRTARGIIFGFAISVVIWSLFILGTWMLL